MKNACDWAMSGVCLVLGAAIVSLGILLLKNTVVALTRWEGEGIFSLLLLSAIPLLVGIGLLLSTVSCSIKRVRQRPRTP